MAFQYISSVFVRVRVAWIEFIFRGWIGQEGSGAGVGETPWEGLLIVLSAEQQCLYIMKLVVSVNTPQDQGKFFKE